MTSLNNNPGAIAALNTLTNINRSLLETQNSIATSRTVNNAADDAALFAVTTVIESDVDGFNAISDSLSLGSATVTVARNAAEQITSLLRDAQSSIITAQGENVDRNLIQADIDAIRDQVTSIVSAAQFNGLNLIDGSTNGTSVLSSLDRTAGGVTASSIEINAQNLSFGSAVAGTGAATAVAFVAQDSVTNAAPAATSSATFSFNGSTVTAGETAQFEVFIDGASQGVVDIASGSNQAEAGSQIANFVAGLGNDSLSVVATGAGLTITNEQTFDSVDVEIRTLNAAGLSVNTPLPETTLDAAGVIQTSSNDQVDEAATIVVNNSTAAESFDITLGGVDLGTFTGVVNGDDDATAIALADFINTAVAADATLQGQVSATIDDVTTDQVNLNNLGGANLDLEITVNTGAGAGAGTDLTITTSNVLNGAGATPVNLAASTGSVGNSVNGVLEAQAADIQFDTVAIAEGDSFTVSLREGTDGEVGEFTFVAAAGDTAEDVARGLQDLIDADDRFDVTTQVVTQEEGANTVSFLQVDAAGSEDVFVAVDSAQGGVASGGLSALGSIDVTTSAGAARALDDIQGLIQTAIDAASAFGSAESRLGIQADFVDSLVQSLNAGVSALVDTDLEEASARLQALQVQQQLATQALSIANASPQNILALFG